MSENNERPQREPPAMFDRLAREDFDVALRKGFVRSVVAWFTQTDNDLLPFDEVRKHLPLRGQHYVGLQQIEVDKIIGSVGRYNDFDRAFLPRQNFTRGRWVSIDRAHMQDVILPPIDVYRIGSVYFVRDGNHRVSVARGKGQVFIDAFVVQMDVPFEVDTNTNIDELLLKAQKVEFYETSHILDVRPAADISFTIPGGYERLLEHISVHRWFKGEKNQAEVLYPEAVAGWYDDVYLPLAKIICKDNILEHFPRRTVADLYLWINEHYWYLRQEYSDISIEHAAIHFTKRYSGGLGNRLKLFWHEVEKFFSRNKRPPQPPPVH